MKNVSLKFLCASLFVCGVLGCASETKFPPQIQDTMKKGILAGREKDYLSAIQYFEEARKILPGDADIHYNLGLAEANIPGRELRAIAWLGAYLAAKPHAVNAAAIKKHIAILDARNLANIGTLIDLYQNSFERVKESSEAQDGYRSRMASLWVRLGDIAKAQEIASRMTYDMGDNLATEISGAQAARGDFAGAFKTVDRMVSDKNMHAAEYSIAVEQGLAGDFVSASQTSIRHDVFKGEEDPEGYRERVAQIKAERLEEEKHLGEVTSVSAWLDLFTLPDDNIRLLNGSRFALMPLNDAPFMDITAFVKSIPSRDPNESEENYKVGLEFGDHYFIDELEKNISRIIDMRNFILKKYKQLLELQAKGDEVK